MEEGRGRREEGGQALTLLVNIVREPSSPFTCKHTSFTVILQASTGIYMYMYMYMHIGGVNLHRISQY